MVEIDCASFEDIEDPALPSDLVKNATKSWTREGWTPKTGLNKHRLFLTKTSSEANTSGIKTILTQTLYGDPTGAHS